MSISRKTKTVKLLLNLFDQEENAISVVDLISFFSNDMNKTTVYRILNRFSWIWTLTLDVFFANKIDFLKSLRVQKCVLPHEVWTLKIVIFPGENTISYKIHVFASKWKSMENTKKTRHNRFKINVFCDVDFWMTFELTWLDFGPQVGALKSERIHVFSQDVSKRRRRGS